MREKPKKNNRKHFRLEKLFTITTDTLSSSSKKSTMAPFTSKKTRLNLGIRKSKVRLPDTKATQEKLKRDEVARKWVHARLDDLFEEFQESKRPSTSTNEAFDATGPSNDEGTDEQSNIPLPEINNPEIPAAYVE